jgi:hemin uptake protein HemP
MRQTRMHPVRWESLPGFKCQTRSTSQQSSTTSPSALRRQIVISENQLDSREPFTGTREIIIVHGDTYRLRLTALSKLILTN